MPDSIAWSTYHEDGTIINRIYMVPADPAVVAQVKALLGPVVMEGLVTLDSLMQINGGLPHGTWIEPEGGSHDA